MDTVSLMIKEWKDAEEFEEDSFKKHQISKVLLILFKGQRCLEKLREK